MSTSHDPTRSHAHPPMPRHQPPQPPQQRPQPPPPVEPPAAPVPHQQPVPGIRDAVTANLARVPLRWRITTVGAVAAGIIAALVFALIPNTFTATGSLSIMDTSTSLGSYSSYSTPSVLVFDDGTCSGNGGYDDLTTGATVTIRNNEQRVVGIGSITSTVGVPGVDGLCSLSFTVPDVPSGEGPYSVEVTHRGEVATTEEELESGATALTIG